MMPLLVVELFALFVLFCFFVQYRMLCAVWLVFGVCLCVLIYVYVCLCVCMCAAAPTVMVFVGLFFIWNFGLISVYVMSVTMCHACIVMHLSFALYVLTSNSLLRLPMVAYYYSALLRFYFLSILPTFSVVTCSIAVACNCSTIVFAFVVYFTFCSVLFATFVCCCYVYAILLLFEWNYFLLHSLIRMQVAVVNIAVFFFYYLRL